MALRNPFLLAAALAAAALAGCSGSVPPSDGGMDTAMHCTTPQMACGTHCIDVTSDSANCGACGHACGAGLVCVMGECSITCPPTQTVCGSSCVTTDTDTANCGACGHACPAGEVCAMGACRTECGSSLMLCMGANGDAGVADGGDGRYCANTHSDRYNCGTCHTACAMGEVCVSGTCQASCPAANTVCSGDCVDTHSDPLHCGDCSTACTASQVCQDGECINTGPCPVGQFMCGTNCVDPQTDVANCGACSHACPLGQDCVTGTCMRTCTGGQMLCGSACVDVTHDPMHCGNCTTACPAGQVCTAGTCGIECPTGQTLCGSVCVDVTTDAANCGGCGMACTGGQLCSGGTCALTCGAGQSLCGGSCASTGVDPANCGSCGHACAAGQACRGGVCQTLEMVDGGCAPPSLFCGAVCANIQEDNINCGGCGRTCTTDRSCVAGNCVAPCPTAQVRCGSGAGTCADLQNDRNNCGTCGTVCSGSGQVCRAGVCVRGAYAGYTESASTMAFIDACTLPGHSSDLPSTDDGTVTKVMPMPFLFYNALNSNFWFSSNGVVGFGTNPNQAYSNACFPTTTFADPVVAAMWDDLRTGTSGVCAAITGTAPNRQYVITWDGTTQLSGSSPMNMSVVLTETADTVDILYGAGTTYDGNSATIGVQGAMGAMPVQHSCNTSTVTAGTGLHYTPM